MSRGKLIDSPEKFLNVVKKSGLLSDDDLSEFASGDEQTRDPVTIARTLIKQGKLTKWQASQLLSGYFQLMIGKYKLCDQIGKGELGSVYLAENAKLGRKVALKVLSRKHTANPELVKRFLDEARAAAALDHRNIIHVHDVTSEGERHYVVMEYVAGQVLQQKVEAGGPLPPDVALACVRQAAEGMQYAHAQQVLHRDLKPANLMVDAQGTVKIMDVGVGQLRESKVDTSSGTGEMMLAATDYQSPEQIRGGEVTARSDIYSLGGVLYFLLSGRAPFAAKSDEERECIKNTKQPVPLSEVAPSVPQRLSDLCQKLMESAPESRPQSMADVITALDELNGAPESSAAEAEVAQEPDAEENVVFPAIDTGKQPKATVENTAIDQPAAKVNELATVEDAAATSTAEATDFMGIKIETGKAGPAASVGPMEFALDTKRRKKSKATPPAKPDKKSEKTAATVPAPSAADAAPEPAKPADAAGDKRRLPWGLIIGGVSAAVVLVLTGVGLAVLFMSGGGDQQVAKAPASGPASTTDANAEANGTATETPTDATGENATTAPAASATGSPDATSEPAAGETTTANPAAGNATTDNAAVAANNAAPTTPAAATAPATAPSETTPAATPMPGQAPVSPAPETPAPTTPAPTSPPAEPAKPAETPPPAKVEPKKEEPKPEPKKEEPKKDQPPTFVFEPAVDLPPVAADAPETLLGKVNIGPQDVVFINLVGGDVASKGKVTFTLQNAQSGVAPRDWEFFLDSGNGDPVVIATMSMPETELKFKWGAASTTSQTATNLRNCSLKISAGQGKPQELALRKPQGIAPVPVSVDKKTSVKWTLEGAPDPASLRLEITVNGHKASVEPAALELGKKNKGEIFFGENREQAALMLKVDTNFAGRFIEVEFEPYFLVPVEKDPVRLNKPSRSKYASIGNARAQYEAFIIQYDKAPQDQKNKLQNQYLQAKQELEMIDKTVAKMTQLDTDIAAVGNGSVTLQCRVYSDSLEKQIDLLVNDPNVAPAAQ